MTAESDLAPVLHIERELRHLSVEITQPKTGECLHCYVYRMLEFGCTGLRWAQRYRDLRAPRATAFRRRLMSKGAGCDCEIFMNGWSLRRTISCGTLRPRSTSTRTSCRPAQVCELARSSPVVSGPPITVGERAPS
jgi:Protein of unknown function (DUF2695)